ncbi:MAG TPA: hypothetical protein VMI75_12570 [Polyangiaceae bacterium]|nr:hypothetical protein [Polyangiaceae bacterium]
MSWFTRYTRFGDAHLVYGQERGMSCGLACVTMLVFKVNKLTPGRTALKTEQEITDVFDRVAGRTYDASGGTLPEELARVLNHLAVGTWSNAYLTGAGVTQKLIDHVGVTAAPGPVVSVEPMIVGVDWDGGGAHWVVVDTIRSFMGRTYATVCDPWDGDVHLTRIEAGRPFDYVAGRVSGSWDLRGAAGALDQKLTGGKNAAKLDKALGKKANDYGAAPATGASKNWGAVFSL